MLRYFFLKRKLLVYEHYFFDGIKEGLTGHNGSNLVYNIGLCQLGLPGYFLKILLIKYLSRIDILISC